MAKIIRYCKLTEEHNGDNAFDVSRPNIFGNPFTHIKNKETKSLVKVKTREEAISLYESYFDTMILTNDVFRKEWDRLYEAFHKFDIVYIGCFCKLNESCHGDIIIKKLRQRVVKEMVNKAKLM